MTHPTATTDQRVHLGSVSVDSGQLMITDPCYIDSTWTREPFQDVRHYRDTTTAATLTYPHDFQRYDQDLPAYSATVNDLLATGRLEPVPQETPTGGYTYSYNGACQATLTPQAHGQLTHRTGRPGAGVAFSSGWGDGTYPVYGTIRDGRIIGVYIDMNPTEN